MANEQRGNQYNGRNRRQRNYSVNRSQAHQMSGSQQLPQKSRPAPYVQPEIHIHLDGNMQAEKKRFSFSSVLYALLAIACCAAAVYLFVTI